MKNIKINNKIKYFELEKKNYKLIMEPLLQDIISVGMDAFGKGMTKEEIKEHIFPTDKLYLSYDQQKVVGFATANLTNNSMDLVGAAVKHSNQGLGIYTELTMRTIYYGLNENKNQISFRTQNPIVEIGIRNNLKHLIDFGLINDYQCDTEFKKNVYGRMLTEKQPLSGLKEFDEKYERINYPRGDTFSFKIKLNKN